MNCWIYRFSAVFQPEKDQGQNPAPELLGGTARFRCTNLRCSWRWNRGWGMIFLILENCHWDSVDALSWINQWYFWCLHQFQLLKVIFFSNPSVAQLLQVVFPFGLVKPPKAGAASVPWKVPSDTCGNHQRQTSPGGYFNMMGTHVEKHEYFGMYDLFQEACHGQD